MENEEFRSKSSDIKHLILIVLVLGALIVSSVNLVLILSGDDTQNAYDIENGSTALTAQDEDVAETTEAEEKEEVDESEFASLLLEKEYYSLPFGAAEIEVYYTTVEKPTSLDESTLTVTCSALVVTDGPELLMNALQGDQFGNPPIVVIGSEDSYWTGISESTKDASVEVLVTLNPLFEGELIGCMSWPFENVIEV